MTIIFTDPFGTRLDVETCFCQLAVDARKEIVALQISLIDHNEQHDVE